MPKLSPKKQKTVMIVPAITLTTADSEAMADYLFWTGFSIEQAVNRAVENFMEIRGEAEMWKVAAEPKKRIAAFKRNGYTPEKIATSNAAVEEDLVERHAKWERDNAKFLKAQKAGKARWKAA